MDIKGVGDAGVHDLRELRANKIRSLLSMSGIILGVASLVAMVTVVQGMVGNFRQFVDERLPRGHGPHAGGIINGGVFHEFAQGPC